MIRRGKAEDLVRHPVVDLHRIRELLPVGLEADVEGRPPGRELDLPHQLPFAVGDLHVPLVAAPLHEPLAQLRPFALVVDCVLRRVERQRLGDVDPLAVLADRGVGEGGLVLRLAHELVDLLPYGPRVREYGPDLLVELPRAVGLGPALERVFDAQLVEGLAEEGAHVPCVGLVAVEGVRDPRHRVGDVVLQPGREPRGDLPQSVEVVRIGDELGPVAEGLEGELDPIAPYGVPHAADVW